MYGASDGAFHPLYGNGAYSWVTQHGQFEVGSALHDILLAELTGIIQVAKQIRFDTFGMALRLKRLYRFALLIVAASTISAAVSRIRLLPCTRQAIQDTPRYGGSYATLIVCAHWQTSARVAERSSAQRRCGSLAETEDISSRVPGRSAAACSCVPTALVSRGPARPGTWRHQVAGRGCSGRHRGVDARQRSPPGTGCRDRWSAGSTPRRHVPGSPSPSDASSQS